MKCMEILNITCGDRKKKIMENLVKILRKRLENFG